MPGGVHTGLQLADDRQLVLLVIGQAGDEIIVAPVAQRHTGGRGVVQQILCQTLQQGVALLGTVKLVVKFEMFDINGGNTPFFIFVSRQKILQLLQKFVFASDLGKHVFRSRADGLSFLQF